MILGIIQARMSSQRLPGKVLALVQGKPMVLRQIERLRRAQRIDQLVVATSVNTEDDPVAALCESEGIVCSRGSLENVLDRFFQAAVTFEPDAVVRLTADCPLADPELIDDLIGFFKAGDYDYASNTLEPTWPDGLDAEVMTMAALMAAHDEATEAFEHEHVTPFLYRHPERFRLGSFKQVGDQSALRWTVDLPEDLEFVKAVYAALYDANPAFGTADIMDFCTRHKKVSALNAGGTRSSPASVLAAHSNSSNVSDET